MKKSPLLFTIIFLISFSNCLFSSEISINNINRYCQEIRTQIDSRKNRQYFVASTAALAAGLSFLAIRGERSSVESNNTNLQNLELVKLLKDAIGPLKAAGEKIIKSKKQKDDLSDKESFFSFTGLLKNAWWVKNKAKQAAKQVVFLSFVFYGMRLVEGVGKCGFSIYNSAYEYFSIDQILNLYKNYFDRAILSIQELLEVFNMCRVIDLKEQSVTEKIDFELKQMVFYLEYSLAFMKYKSKDYKFLSDEADYIKEQIDNLFRINSEIKSNNKIDANSVILLLKSVHDKLQQEQAWLFEN